MVCKRSKVTFSTWTFLQCSSIKLHEAAYDVRRPVDTPSVYSVSFTYQIIRANQPGPGKSDDCFSYLHNTFKENKPLSCQEEQFTGNCNKSGRSPFKKCRRSLSSLFINRWTRQQECNPPPCIDVSHQCMFYVHPEIFLMSWRFSVIRSFYTCLCVELVVVGKSGVSGSRLILLSTISSIGTYSLPSVGLWWWKRLNQEY